MANIIMVLAMLLSGVATYYSPGVFEEVWDNRSQTMEPCADCVGYAAMDCKYLGQKVWVSNGDEWVGPLYVIDCGPIPSASLPRHVVEVDYWLAKKWDMRAPIEVVVTFQKPKEITDEDRCRANMRYMRETHRRWNPGFC